MIEIDLDGVLFRGKFDRIDILKDGTAVIFGLQDGAGQRPCRIDAASAYAVLLEKAKGIKTSGLPSSRRPTVPSQGRLEGLAGAILARWKKRSRNGLTDMISLASGPSAPCLSRLRKADFPPDYTNTEVCRYCEFQEICRRKESP
jgi:hypothetical protein